MSKEGALLIIGASSDIGTALLKRYEGPVIAHYHRDKTVLEPFKDKVSLVHGDLSDSAGIEAFICGVRALDCTVRKIVHLPAIPPRSSRLRELDIASFVRELHVSVVSAAALCREFLPLMAKQKFGRVVFMLTSYVIGVPPKFLASYIAGKYALEGLMKAAAVEYAGKGITINAVAPYMIETKFLQNVPDLAIQQSAQSNPTGRNATLADVLPAIEFLLADANEYITGAILPVTGGQTL